MLLSISDWIIVLLAAIIALALSDVNPDFHTFHLLEMSISHPHRPQAKVSKLLLIFLAIAVPALVITLLSFYWPPRSNTRRLSHLNTSLLGLGVSLATSTIIFTGVKNLTGKPRPDSLEICQPDAAHVADYVVGPTYAAALSARMAMVTAEICQQEDKRYLRDGFRSFPSGYATVAFAGLWYLTLYSTAKFRILPRSGSSSGTGAAQRSVQLGSTDEAFDQDGGAAGRNDEESTPPPRTVLLILPYVPLGLAIFLAGTRYFDFRNHGWDVLAGAAVGTATATFAFRLYGGDVGE